MPKHFSLKINLLCGTLSKAFLKSNYEMSTGNPSSMRFAFLFNWSLFGWVMLLLWQIALIFIKFVISVLYNLSVYK